MPNQNPWYVLTQIFAILSGTWMFASAMYLNLATSMLFAQQNTIDIAVNTLNLNNTNLTNTLINLSGTFIFPLKGNLVFSSIGFFAAVLFGGLSIVFWFKGKKESNNYS